MRLKVVGSSRVTERSIMPCTARATSEWSGPSVGASSEAVLVTLWLRWLQAVRLQTKPNMMPLHKLTAAFIATLMLMDDSKPRSLAGR
jgi:hypothetical protein